MIYRYILFFFIISLLSCNSIEKGDKLEKTDMERIQNLNLLDEDEKIYKFYSEITNETAGNFFTNKRLANYWIDKRDKTKNEVNFAFYSNIKSIDTIYNAGATYCPYMLITKKDDGSNFKVYVDGTHQEIKIFFEEAILLWKQNRGIK